MRLMRTTLLAALVAAGTALASRAQAVPFLLPSYDVSGGGAVLIQTHAGSQGVSNLQMLPIGIPNPPGFAPVNPAYREYGYLSPDPCFILGGGASFTCSFPDLLNDPAAMQHWEFEIHNPGSTAVTLNTFFTLSAGAASAFFIGLGAQSTLQLDFLVPEFGVEVATRAATITSSTTFPLGFTFAVTEGGLPTALTPPGTPPYAASGACPGPATTLQPCMYAFHTAPGDFIVAGSDPNAPAVYVQGFIVPEPASLGLLAAGLGLLALTVGHRR